MVSNNGLEIETSGDSKSSGSAEFVFDNCVQVSMVVYLEFDAAVIVKSMQKSKSSLKDSLLPIKSELSANSLGEGCILMEVEEELAEFEFTLVGRFVL